MVNGDSIRNMEETEVEMDKIQQVLDLAKEVLGKHEVQMKEIQQHEVKMKEIQQMVASAKKNDGHSFVNLSMQVGVRYFGTANIGQVSVWDQKTQQMVTFVLKSNLDENAKPWLPQGSGQEYKEGEAVEEGDSGSGHEYKEGEDVEIGDINTEQHDGNDSKISLPDVEVEDTNVETMSVEQIVKHMAQEIEQLSEDKQDVKQRKDEQQRVQHVRSNSNGMRICEGHAAVLKQAQIMFRQNMVLCQANVVNYYVSEGMSQKRYRLFAQKLVEEVCVAWDAWIASEEYKHGVSFSSKGGKVLCLAKKILCLELDDGMREFELKYLEGGSCKTETCKNMIKRICNALRITLTEMSVMYDYFATAEEDDMWKSWGTSDDYLEVLTLRYTMDEECEQFDSSDESE